jgi:hypothetical protein
LVQVGWGAGGLLGLQVVRGTVVVGGVGAWVGGWVGGEVAGAEVGGVEVKVVVVEVATEGAWGVVRVVGVGVAGLGVGWGAVVMAALAV